MTAAILAVRPAALPFVPSGWRGTARTELRGPTRRQGAKVMSYPDEKLQFAKSEDTLDQSIAEVEE